MTSFGPYIEVATWDAISDASNDSFVVLTCPCKSGLGLLNLTVMVVFVQGRPVVWRSQSGT